MRCSKYSCRNDATRFMIVWDSIADRHPSVFPRCEGCFAGDRAMIRKHRIYGSDRVVSVRIPGAQSAQSVVQ